MNYNKKLLADLLNSNGFKYQKGRFINQFGPFKYCIWVQAGVRSYEGKFTINFEIVHDDILKIIRPNIESVKGNHLISYRIGELLGVHDKWYNPIVPKYIDEMTAEAVADIKICLPRFLSHNDEEKIAKILWEKGKFLQSILVMATYLNPEKIEEIVNKFDGVVLKFKDEILQYSRVCNKD